MARGGLSAAGRQMAMRLLPFTVTLWFCLTAWSTAASMRTRFCVSCRATRATSSGNGQRRRARRSGAARSGRSGHEEGWGGHTEGPRPLGQASPTLPSHLSRVPRATWLKVMACPRQHLAGVPSSPLSAPPAHRSQMSTSQSSPGHAHTHCPTARLRPHGPLHLAASLRPSSTCRCWSTCPLLHFARHLCGRAVSASSPPPPSSTSSSVRCDTRRAAAI